VINFSFSFRVKKSNYCTNLTIGGILNRHGHFKHTLRAQRCRDCGRWTLPCHTVPISHGSTAISGRKKCPLQFYWIWTLLSEYLSYFRNQSVWKVILKLFLNTECEGGLVE
jgi:hypothetical protein